jgi:hypothetical protein
MDHLPACPLPITDPIPLLSLLLISIMQQPASRRLQTQQTGTAKATRKDHRKNRPSRSRYGSVFKSTPTYVQSRSRNLNTQGESKQRMYARTVTDIIFFPTLDAKRLADKLTGAGPKPRADEVGSVENRPSPKTKKHW